MPYFDPILTLQDRLPQGLKPLAPLSFNYWWTWSGQQLRLFNTIDHQLWEACHHNPVLFLQKVSRERLDAVATDPDYVQMVQTLMVRFRQYMQFQDCPLAPQISPERPVAYFCAEFGLHESLPIYSGGLGILAGDHLKSASDLALPLVGVGLLYRQGYFRQRLNRQGWQEDYYIDNQFSDLPLELMRSPTGEPLTLTVEIRGRQVVAQIWRVRVGRTDLYLMDSDVAENDPIDRWLTGHLYGGNQETRIAQEVLLGIGGVRLLQTLGLEPGVYHLNEGHAAFALLEVARGEMARTGQSFYGVEGQVRQKCVFTTHTPVPAGHDAFSPDLMDSFFASYWPQLHLSREQFLALGARRLGDPWEPFNMTVLALRLTRAANGVSQLHGEVSRQMWSILYPDQPVAQVPIGAITNGVHAQTWTAPLVSELFRTYVHPEWETHLPDPELWVRVSQIPDRELWQRHQTLKQRLISYTRSHLFTSREQRGETPEQLEAIARWLDPQVLTIGFARRFSPYKRGHLIIRDPERAKRLLTHSERPVQLIFAGKAHPADEEGKRIIQRLMEWCRDPDIQPRVAFIEDYDMHTARALVQGVDLWLNNPRRPLEASGTSGQKVCFNGGINFSVLDGWWCEGYQAGVNGWAIGEDLHTSNQELQDQLDSESLYRLLENEIIPMYYDRDGEGLPRQWLQRMKASIRTNIPRFNTARMVQDYINHIYAPSPELALSGKG
ncbi:Glucan phosphorylase [Gloeomargarita lithophora Alchichica-D10]|uniref:Glucan phosphorylase n=1 Tax=Gloeomargarita lithophora Alchichica-D10 TaxID=1188229 RepID=A0A1J0AE08_9CYAN|nr:alpha-glucan family phosphorylase [Gloeomargarita lithophora]APB34169.1 Glucan phosphorylase [Gloeomargarita lithophora Alchichica-D10]